jgi:hypothetical protein
MWDVKQSMNTARDEAKVQSLFKVSTSRHLRQ